MSPSKPPVFFERRAYRRRRMRDAARLLPVIGLLILLLPMFWALDPDTPASTARGVVYVFVAWAALIAVAAWLSRAIAEPPGGETADEEGGEA